MVYSNLRICFINIYEYGYPAPENPDTRHPAELLIFKEPDPEIEALVTRHLAGSSVHHYPDIQPNIT